MSLLTSMIYLALPYKQYYTGILTDNQQKKNQKANRRNEKEKT